MIKLTNRKRLASIVVSLMLLLAGCSAISPQDTDNNRTESPSTAVTTPQPETPKENLTERTPETEEPNESQNKKLDQFERTLRASGVDVLNVTAENRVLYVNYVGYFNDYYQVRSDISKITTKFSNILNTSEVRNDNGSFDRMVIGGFATTTQKNWQFRTESWWAIKYRQTEWDERDFVNATLDTGEEWNLTTQEPPQYGSAYMAELRSRLEGQTEVEIESLEQHGAEAFITYETDRQSNTNTYYSQVVNVSNTYRNFTLPRRLDQTDGWYAGVLNIEVRDGNDTVEWYRYRMWWAEDVANGELTRRQELHYLLSDSRFPKSD